jgi:hypothetical protein
MGRNSGYTAQTMPPIETFQANVTLIKDLVTILAALVAAYVGYTGLQTWKRQLTANAERELARRVLIAVYKVRSAIRLCRLPMMEHVSDSDAVLIKKMQDVQIAQLDAAKTSLEVELLEAQAVWGDEDEYTLAFGSLQIAAMEMHAAYSMYYSETDEPHKEWAYQLLFYDMNPGDEDEYLTSLGNTVKKIEVILRPKLTLKPAKSKIRRWWDRLRK